jgi:hypothetical protein
MRRKSFEHDTRNVMGIDSFGMVFGLDLSMSFRYWRTGFLQMLRVILAKIWARRKVEGSSAPC